MGLAAWWKLGGDTKNSVSDNDLTQTNSAYCYQTTGGKVINECWKSTSHNYGSLVSRYKLNLGRRQSLFCWIYLEGDICSEASLNAICGQHRYPLNAGLGLTTRYIDSSSCYLSINTGHGSDRTYNYYCGETVLTLGKWYHVGYVFDDGYLTLYVNGKPETIWLRTDGGSTSTGTTRYTNSNLSSQVIYEDYFGAFLWSFNSSSTDSTELWPYYMMTGKIQDIRAFDHAVSNKEAEEMYCACIIHYDFNGGSNDAITNYMPSEVTSHTGGVGAYWNGSIAANVTKDGYKCFSITNYPSNQYGDGFIANPASLTVGNVYTYSGYIYVPSGKSFRVGMRASSGGNYDNVTINGNDSWQYFSHTFTMISGMTGHLEGSESSSYTDSTVYYIRNLKIESGEVATPFTPTGSLPVIYDTSGFGNNAAYDISSGVDIYKSSTSNHGEVSGYFNGTNSFAYIGEKKGKLKDNITINIWAKGSNFGEGIILSCTENGGWNFEKDDSGSGIRFAVFIEGDGYHLTPSTTSRSTLNDGKWHMITGSYDGSDIKIYIDGKLEGITHVVGKIGYNSSNNIIIGAESNGTEYGNGGYYFNGHISEIEIFANALSDDVIESRYRSKVKFSDKYSGHAAFVKETCKNMAEPMNYAMYKKAMWTNGLCDFTQANCMSQLTDKGFRIYRPANLIYPDAGHTMWGGMRLQFLNLGNFKTVSYTNSYTGAASSYSQSDFFQKGHRYRISFHVSGYSSNAVGQVGFSNEMGWDPGNSGLMPAPTVHDYLLLSETNFGIVNGVAVGAERDCYYDFTITDDVYKVCTGPYGGYTAGTIYPAYRDFKFGFDYQSTGAHGTDLYISNIVCEDITATGDNKGLTPNGSGILNARTFTERECNNTPLTISDSGNITSGVLYETSTGLANTEIQGNLYSKRVHGASITFDGLTDHNIVETDIASDRGYSLVTLAQVKAFVDDAFGL